MDSPTLHIISFNIPFPANYGGVIDVFYKIKALHQEGVQIILHAFEYGRDHAEALEQYCQAIHYYHRPVNIANQISTLPFIVKSRNAKALLQNLKKDNHPILFEGLHTCYFLNHSDLVHRKKYIRMHNVEWQYYEHLANVETNLIKKSYFKIESEKLKSFEKKIKDVNALLVISKGDKDYFGKKYSSIANHYISAFHPNEKVDGKEGRGEYILFHGDLSVKDNEEAVLFLLNNVAESVDCQWVISGLNPSNQLKEAIAKTKNVILKSNVSNEEMEKLIKNAHVNILLSFHSAGMKLKLLNSLYKGRFCVVNDFMVKDSGLEELCYVENKSDNLINVLNVLLEKEFTSAEIFKRKKYLEIEFSNKKKAEKIVEIIFSK